MSQRTRLDELISMIVVGAPSCGKSTLLQRLRSVTTATAAGDDEQRPAASIEEEEEEEDKEKSFLPRDHEDNYVPTIGVDFIIRYEEMEYCPCCYHQQQNQKEEEKAADSIAGHMAPPPPTPLPPSSTNSAKNVKLQIWDTAGAKRFKTIVTSYFRGINCVVLCFDVTKMDSLHALREIYNEALDQVGPHSLYAIVVLGLKADGFDELVKDHAETAQPPPSSVDDGRCTDIVDPAAGSSAPIGYRTREVLPHHVKSFIREMLNGTGSGCIALDVPYFEVSSKYASPQYIRNLFHYIGAMCVSVKNRVGLKHRCHHNEQKKTPCPISEVPKTIHWVTNNYSVSSVSPFQEEEQREAETQAIVSVPQCHLGSVRLPAHQHPPDEIANLPLTEQMRHVHKQEHFKDLVQYKYRYRRVPNRPALTTSHMPIDQ